MEENQQLQYEQQFEPIVDPNMEPITDPNDVPRGSAIASMILGIASLATSGSVPVAGIVLAAIARAKANAFLREHPNTSASGFAKLVHAGESYKDPSTNLTRHLPHFPLPPQSACKG